MRKFISIFFITYLLSISCTSILLTGSSEKKSDYKSSAEFNFLYAEGLRLKLLGDMDEAAEYFEKCLRYKPQNDAVYYQLAQVMIAKGNIENGKRFLLKSENLNRENVWYNLMLSDIYQKENKYDSAIYFIEKSLNILPGNNDIQMKAAELYSITNNYKKAAEIFKQIEQKYEVNEKTGLILIQNYLKAEDFDSAEKTLLKLLELYPDEVFYKSLLADVYYKKGLKDKAYKLYSYIIENNLNDVRSLELICDFLIDEKEYNKLLGIIDETILRNDIKIEEKIACFKKIIENEQLVDSMFNDIEERLIKFEDEVRDNSDVLMLRPELYEKSGREIELENRLIEIINKNKENYPAWEKLILFYADKKEWDKLFLYAGECSREFNLSYIAKILYANAALEKSEYTIALQEIGKAKILAGNLNEAMIQAMIIEAEIYYRLNEYEKCFMTFEEILKRDADNIIALNNYAYFLAENNKNLDKAFKMSEKVISTAPENATFLDTYAWILFKMGKVKKAIDIMEEIISDKNNNDAEYFEHYGFMLKSRKDCKNAVNAWKKAKEIDEKKIYLEEEINNCTGKIK